MPPLPWLCGLHSQTCGAPYSWAGTGPQVQSRRSPCRDPTQDQWLGGLGRHPPAPPASGSRWVLKRGASLSPPGANPCKEGSLAAEGRAVGCMGGALQQPWRKLRGQVGQRWVPVAQSMHDGSCRLWGLSPPECQAAGRQLRPLALIPRGPSAWFVVRLLETEGGAEASHPSAVLRGHRLGLVPGLAEGRMAQVPPCGDSAPGKGPLWLWGRWVPTPML